MRLFEIGPSDDFIGHRDSNEQWPTPGTTAFAVTSDTFPVSFPARSVSTKSAGRASYLPARSGWPSATANGLSVSLTYSRKSRSSTRMSSTRVGSHMRFVGWRFRQSKIKGDAIHTSFCFAANQFITLWLRNSDWPLTFVRRAIGWLASPKRRTELRRAGRPRRCRGSALPSAWTRRAGVDAATCRGRKPP